MTLLEVKNLTKKFKSKKGEVMAVDQVSFSADRGEIFGLLGPNGAGKTTTIRLIATTLSADDGTAIVAGFDIHKNPEEVRKHIGVLTTDLGSYDRFSGRENLRYFGKLYGLEGEKLESRIEELINLLEMQDFIDKRAGKYSTGMKQKLAIARSVIHDPDIIFFDEPTAGLDVLASQTVMQFMRQAKEDGKCVILSTHQMPDAERLCDRVAIIHRGKLIANNTIPALKEQTRAANLEDVFLALVKEKHLETRPGDAEMAGKKIMFERKVKITGQLRIAFLIVVLLGIAVMFLWSEQRMIGNALVLIGALGAVMTKTYLKKYKK